MEAVKNGSSMVVEFADGLSIDARRNCFIQLSFLVAIAASTAIAFATFVTIKQELKKSYHQ